MHACQNGRLPKGIKQRRPVNRQSVPPCPTPVMRHVQNPSAATFVRQHPAQRRPHGPGRIARADPVQHHLPDRLYDQPGP